MDKYRMICDNPVSRILTLPQLTLYFPTPPLGGVTLSIFCYFFCAKIQMVFNFDDQFRLKGVSLDGLEYFSKNFYMF